MAFLTRDRKFIGDIDLIKCTPITARGRKRKTRENARHSAYGYPLTKIAIIVQRLRLKYTRCNCGQILMHRDRPSHVRSSAPDKAPSLTFITNSSPSMDTRNRSNCAIGKCKFDPSVETMGLATVGCVQSTRVCVAVAGADSVLEAHYFLTIDVADLLYRGFYLVYIEKASGECCITPDDFIRVKMRFVLHIPLGGHSGIPAGSRHLNRTNCLSYRCPSVCIGGFKPDGFNTDPLWPVT